ncbi:hypothetical protein ATCV1_z554R [Acanthocystis turfacea chlorella virus 1]|uniref:Uncharacterized protein z554R n=1 Tax=Chlorovirus heliozoae TaxID=322019 RepID=A7K9G4_9PHYC|nr:hypothetical protein ATCV1_z554R [Acanthocystis turfacea chlorella virus 1]ABT16688.1 hypothetical protein ATCV1_z554R [Acanthocystis turfacea chlorella virus 1]
MSVHIPECFVPAHAASVNFLIPVSRTFFAPSVFLRFFISTRLSRTLVSAMTSSRTADTAFFRKAAEGEHFTFLLVRMSLVCDENEGFTTRALTKMKSLFLTTAGLTVTFFLSAASATALATALAMRSTWVPPRVDDALTNDTDRNSSDGHTPMSQPSTDSNTGLASVYISK